MQQLYEKSANEKSSKIDRELMPPPSVLKLLEAHEAEDEPNCSTDKQFAAGFAAIHLAHCAEDCDDNEMVSGPLLFTHS